VQGVFHAPVAADRRGQGLGVVAGEAGDKVTTFGGGLAAQGCLVSPFTASPVMV